MRVMFIEEFEELGVAGAAAEAKRIVGDGPTYISFDVDGPGPGLRARPTGTPEVGGITTREALSLLALLPAHEPDRRRTSWRWPRPSTRRATHALVGATLMYEILCLLAESRRG